METDGICSSQTWQKAVSEWVISNIEENRRDSKGAPLKRNPPLPCVHSTKDDAVRQSRFLMSGTGILKWWILSK